MKKIHEMLEALKTTNEGAENSKTVAVIEALAAEVEKMQKAAAKPKK